MSDEGRPEPSDMVVVFRGEMTETGYRLPPDLTFEEWASEAPTLIRVAQSAMWWLGDYLAYGEARWPDKWAQVIEATGYSEQTLKNALWVSTRIPPSERRLDVPFSQHRAVASLDPQPRRKLLDEAATRNLSEYEVRTRVREIKAEVAAGGTAPPPAPERTLDDLLRDALGRLDRAIEDHDWSEVGVARGLVAEARSRRDEIRASS